MTREDTIAEWLDRLARTFRGLGGTIGERLREVRLAEKRYWPTVVAKSYGFTVLLDSFQDFYLQTFEEGRAHDRVKNVNTYAILAASFYRLRYALLGFQSGYPYDAGASIRALFEIAFLLGAVLNGYIPHDALFAFAKDEDFAAAEAEKKMKIHREHVQVLDRQVSRRMRGDQSGLGLKDQQQIARILRLLHGHVHRAESSIAAGSLDMAKKRLLPSLMPEFDERKANSFATHMVYACWLLHRVLPYLSHPMDFSDDWQEKYSVLDHSLWFYVQHTKGEGYEAYCRMVESRFTFDVESAWKHVEIVASG